MSKTLLGLEDIEAQSVLELPSRETMLVFVVIGDIASGNTIRIPIRDNQVAVQICAALVLAGVSCKIEQAGRSG